MERTDLGNGLWRDDKGILHNNYGAIYGYCRVSTAEQKLDRQIDNMLRYGLKQSWLFCEKESGAKMNRPMLTKLLRVLRRGDLLVILSIDRLGRNMQEVLDTWKLLTTDIGVGIHVLDNSILNTSGAPDDLTSQFITQIMLQVLAYVAENERKQTLHRQKQGYAAMMRKIELGGKPSASLLPGRPRQPFPSEFWTIYCLWRTGSIPAKQLLHICQAEWGGSGEENGVSQRTFWRRLREIDQRYGDIPPEKLKDYVPFDLMEQGILYDAERVERVAYGYYNPYIEDYDGKILERLRKYSEMADVEAIAKMEANERREREEELRRMVFEARQQNFREKFGLDDPNNLVVKRGRGARNRNTTGDGRQPNVPISRKALDEVDEEEFRMRLGIGAVPRKTTIID